MQEGQNESELYKTKIMSYFILFFITFGVKIASNNAHGLKVKWFLHAYQVNEFLLAQAEDKSRFIKMTKEEVGLGFINVANETMCRPIRALTQVWLMKTAPFGTCLRHVMYFRDLFLNSFHH